MNPCSLFLFAIAVSLHSRPSYETDELDEINSFVQAVLAVADRDKLGLPEVSEPVKPYTSTADGKLSPELQRYLEKLLSVSSDTEKHKLVDMLWDNTIVVDEDQEPCDVFDKWNGIGHNVRGQQKPVETSSPAVAVRKYNGDKRTHRQKKNYWWIIRSKPVTLNAARENKFHYDKFSV